MWMLLQRIKMQKSKTAYEAALHLLKYRGQSTYELRKKLKRQGISFAGDRRSFIETFTLWICK